MARGGSRGRRSSYVRDNSGRFASTPGGGPPKRSTPASRRAARPKVTGGTLGVRSSVRRSRAKLAAKNPADRSLRGSLSLRAQKGAVTRGTNRLGKVRAASTVRLAGKGAAGVIRGRRKVVGKPVAAQPRPSTPARKPAALKWEKRAGSAGRQTASLPNGRRVNVTEAGGRVTASIFNERDRSPVMDRSDFRNVTEAKKWAASPSARGPRILGRYQPSMKRRKAWEMPTDASPSLANIQGKKARPSGTLAKPRNLKPGAIAARKAKAAAPAKAKSKAGAARSAGRTQKQRIAQYERVAAKLGKQIKKAESNLNASPGPQGFSREREISRAQRLSALRKRERRAGKWLNSMLASKPAPTPRKPSPKGAGPRTKAARPAGTVVKPRGLKVGAIAGGKAKAAQPQKKKKVDYAGAVKLLSRQKAAIGRLKNPQQTFNGNGAYARQLDVRTAKSTPTANAQREIRASYGEYRRAQGDAKNPYASQEVRSRAANKLPALRKQVRKAAQAARAFKPEYSAETRRRFQAAQARRRR
jgi:hypothetical protein